MVLTKAKVWAQKNPVISMAIGTKKCELIRSEYFCSLCSSALVATFPAARTAKLLWDQAKVSGHVASHTKGFPEDQGVTVTQSRRLPSLLERPEGSKREGTLTEVRDLQMISLIAACL